MTRIVLILVAVMLAVGPLAACGKKGALEPPPTEQKKDDE